VLDAALTRPGRFDRRVPVTLPDKDGRVEILKVHSKGKPLSADVELDVIAKRTIGFSGAQLANLMNEAAIVSARRDKTDIGYDEVDYALDRLTVGMQRAKGAKPLSEARQRLVAYHEAGHAICGLLAKNYDTVNKVTIIPRSSGAGGFTLFTPSDEQMESGLYSKSYLKAQLEVALGGRVAEELVYGKEEITTGASSDLQQVMNIARRMVTQWGYANDKLGTTAWESAQGGGPFDRPDASPATLEKVDEAMRILVDEAYAKCKATLSDNRQLMETLVDKLLEKETVSYLELQQILAEYEGRGMQNAAAKTA